MAINLLEMMSGSVGQSLISQAGKFLGAPESTMRSAVDAALPAMLGGVMQKGATPQGASEVMKLFNTPGLESGITENLGSYLGGGEKTNSLLSMGSGLLSSLFGDKASGLVNTLGSMFGMKSASASNLLALAAPMTLGFLKNYVGKNRLDAGGLSNLLTGQSDFLKSRLDNRLTGALGFGSVGAFLSSVTGGAGRAASATAAAGAKAYDTVGEAGSRAYDTVTAKGSQVYDTAANASSAAAATGPSFRRWLPWIILAALVVLAIPLLRNCQQDARRTVDTVGDAASTATQATSDAAKAAARGAGDAARATTQAAGDAARATTQAAGDAAAGATAAAKGALKSFELPNGVKMEVPEGGFMASMIASLSGKDAPSGGGYRLDGVSFETGSATLKPESTKQLEQLALLLKAYPKATLNIVGHTDNTGDDAANKALSAQRASAVEKQLQSLGVADARITSAGSGAEKPIASNDTEEGRAQNRRVEVVVVQR